MSETWRDIVNDAICDCLEKTRQTIESDSVNEEARDICDAIFDALEIEPALQDTKWTAFTIAEGDGGIKFEHKTGIQVRTRYGDTGYITMLGYTECGRKLYLITVGLDHNVWLPSTQFSVIPFNAG